MQVNRARRDALRAGIMLAVGAILGPTVLAAATTIEGVAFEPRLALGGRILVLNGAGLRAVAWLKGYAAALYLPGRAGSADQVLAMAGPKRLRLHMLVDVPVAELVKAFHKGIARNAPTTAQPGLAERMARFDALVQPIGQVRRGDAVDLDYLPDSGLVISRNGRALGPAIEGDDFYEALLSVFIGTRPVDDTLKTGLLGGTGRGPG